MKAPGVVFDLEADGLKPTKIHCICTEEGEVTGNDLFNNDILVGHNITRFDIPVIERLTSNDKYKGSIVDTLALSWYLYPDRKSHGLDSWGEDFGIKKPEIDDWEGLSKEEYLHRCQEDVKINSLLWNKQYKYLLRIYGSDEKVRKFLRYIQFKMYCARLQEESRWKLDILLCESTIEKFEKIKEEKVNELRAKMPSVPIRGIRKKPKKVFNADGKLSAFGQKWEKLLESKGLDFGTTEIVEVTTGYDEPNPNSNEQIKQWLYSLGWVPRTFKTNDKGIEVPQINKPKQEGGGICESIKEMFEDHPELSALEGLSVLSHRLSILRGYLRDVDDGFLSARIAGLTNTLRFKHQELVNLPKSDNLYAKEIRECLIAPDDETELCGSDMSSLEDRTKQHYMYPYDPEFVLEMSKPGFDPHLDLAESDGALSKEQVNEYKSGTILSSTKTIRGVYKNGNYSCTYGAGPPKIAKTIGGTLEQGKRIHTAYWKRNWSLKKIADSVKVQTIGGVQWLYNPVSGFWYWLKNPKDKFSTLNQGTATFCFDVWVMFIIQKRPQLTGQFHDEIILTVNKGYRERVKSFLQDALDKANDYLQLNRKLDIDVQFNNSYGGIH